MARIRNPENRNAILEAAVHEIALAGLSAPTAKIAQRAGIASGTRTPGGPMAMDQQEATPPIVARTR